MTQRDIELQIESKRYYIADKFKDIQMNANTLKYAENQASNYRAFVKITDAIDEVKKAYEEISELEVTSPEEEEDSGWNSW